MVSPQRQLGHSRSSRILFVGTAVAGLALVSTPIVWSMGGTHEVAKSTPSARPSVSVSRVTIDENFSGRVSDGPTTRRVTPKATRPGDKETPSPSPSHSSSPSAVPVQPRPVTSPTPRWTETVVNGTSVLTPGQSWSTNRITMAFQGDGNFVLYDRNGTPRWQSATVGRGAKVVFQDDGNLVVYTSDMSTAWSSRTNGHDGAQLVLGRDGVATIRSGGSVLWSSGASRQ